MSRGKSESHKPASLSARSIGLWLGPILAGLILISPVPDGLSFAAWGTAALMVWMAIWWATEAIPIPATSLLPLIVLPLVGAASPASVGASYGHHIVLLLLGGFIIALGIERWDLHRRLALTIVTWVGAGPRALIAGFMLATALLSMWISNTATSLMMVPIALSAASVVKDPGGKFTPALLLGICYAASIGGVATPIGTPTNLIALDWLQQETGSSLGFVQWMAFGIPAVCLLIPAAWFSVCSGLQASDRPSEALTRIRSEKDRLGRMQTAESRVALIFALIAGLWVTRLWTVEGLTALGWTRLSAFRGAEIDMMIAMLGAMAMFIVPAGQKEKRALLNWQEASRLPWGVLLLFGGGLALGRSVRETGLSVWIGESLAFLNLLPVIVCIGLVVGLVIFLTELTSNVATMTTLAPIMGGLAVAVGVAPSSLLAPAAVAASCAFMLPVATAPNAVVYATRMVSMGQMIRCGLRVNLIGIIIITLIGVWLAPRVL